MSSLAITKFFVAAGVLVASSQLYATQL
ncbi:MAG: hypothetical protein JWO80_206, partial [Bryobacterales bacterium]|nr:hypothetical protein [Bryobacterales bacterium]